MFAMSDDVSPAPPSSRRIFLCHSSGDKLAVRTLYQRLRENGFNPWLDEEDILPGQDWGREISQAVRLSAIVLVCLSPSSITKAGYVQKELKQALDLADEQPDGSIFLIPVKLTDCDVPERLRQWQWVNLFEERGYDRLLTALRTRFPALSIATITANSPIKSNVEITVTNSYWENGGTYFRDLERFCDTFLQSCFDAGFHNCNASDPGGPFSIVVHWGIPTEYAEEVRRIAISSLLAFGVSCHIELVHTSRRVNGRPHIDVILGKREVTLLREAIQVK